MFLVGVNRGNLPKRHGRVYWLCQRTIEIVKAEVKERLTHRVCLIKTTHVGGTNPEKVLMSVHV